MLYKFINEHRVERATNPLFVDGIAYSNATDETLVKLGYKEMLEQAMPVKEGFYAMPLYSDGEVISKAWELVKKEEGVI